MIGAPSHEQIVQMTKELQQARYASWVANELFTWQWWIILVTLVAPWIVFYYLADRKQLPRLMLFGSFLILVSILLDIIGFELGFWSYPYKLIPFGPIVAYIDVSPLPVIYMLEYQYFPRWKTFSKVAIATALVFAFIFEPILEFLGIYLPLSWYHYYGLPIYILLPILMRLAVEKVFASAKETS